jgi:hypothetical protein
VKILRGPFCGISILKLNNLIGIHYFINQKTLVYLMDNQAFFDLYYYESGSRILETFGWYDVAYGFIRTRRNGFIR